MPPAAKIIERERGGRATNDQPVRADPADNMATPPEALARRNIGEEDVGLPPMPIPRTMQRSPAGGARPVSALVTGSPTPSSPGGARGMPDRPATASPGSQRHKRYARSVAYCLVARSDRASGATALRGSWLNSALLLKAELSEDVHFVLYKILIIQGQS